MIVAMFPTRHCWCKNSCLWRKRTNQISAAHNGTYWYGQWGKERTGSVPHRLLGSNSYMSPFSVGTNTYTQYRIQESRASISMNPSGYSLSGPLWFLEKKASVIPREFINNLHQNSTLTSVVMKSFGPAPKIWCLWFGIYIWMRQWCGMIWIIHFLA